MNSEWNLEDFKKPEGKGILEKEEEDRTLRGTKGNTGTISLYVGPARRKKLARKAKEANESLSRYLLKKLIKYDIV